MLSKDGTNMMASGFHLHFYYKIKNWRFSLRLKKRNILLIFVNLVLILNVIRGNEEVEMASGEERREEDEEEEK